jgi:hypothetical protein
LFKLWIKEASVTAVALSRKKYLDDFRLVNSFSWETGVQDEGVVVISARQFSALVQQDLGPGYGNM